jgi:hypothetical protein
VRLDDGAVDVEPGAGRASLRATDLHILDFFNIPNALFHTGPSPVAATVSFDVEWTGPVTDRSTVRDATNHFEGRFFSTSAQISWSGTNANGFGFVSDPMATSHSVFAEIGEERNGVFFH